MTELLKGEGETRIQERVRVKCEFCGADATKQHTFLLAGARRNPASSAFGRDDCSYCSDHHVYTCEGGDCVRQARDVEGYEPCSIFTCVERFSHMFLTWETMKRKVEL